MLRMLQPLRTLRFLQRSRQVRLRLIPARVRRNDTVTHLRGHLHMGHRDHLQHVSVRVQSDEGLLTRAKEDLHWQVHGNFFVICKAFPFFRAITEDSQLTIQNKEQKHLPDWRFWVGVSGQR